MEIALHHSARLSAPRASTIVATKRPVQSARFGAGLDPATVRMMGRCRNFSVESAEYFSRLSVVWSQEKQGFVQVEEQCYYNKDKKTYGTPGPVGLNFDLRHGSVLSGDFVAGTLVDGANKRLILPDGRWIDGPTGNIYSAHGDLLMTLDPAQQAAAMPPRTTFEKVI